VSIVTTDEPMTTGEGPGWIPSPLYRLTLQQYEAMVDSGVFSGRDRLHLISGYLVAKMTQNDLHATADELCGEALSRTIPSGWHVRAAKPIRIPSQASKPEPDRCIARGSIRDYLKRSPEPADIALVVEISATSLGEDRKQAALYAAAGIPVYWIVNLVDRQLEVNSEPSLAGYQSRTICKPGESVPVVLDGEEIGRMEASAVLP
jgi:Uma2 family endonuclease